jgi:hypothetical protein
VSPARRGSRSERKCRGAAENAESFIEPPAHIIAPQKAPDTSN